MEPFSGQSNQLQDANVRNLDSEIIRKVRFSANIYPGLDTLTTFLTSSEGVKLERKGEATPSYGVSQFINSELNQFL